MNNEFDIVIMGGGHAGLEAAWLASSFSQLKVALISMPGVQIGSTPCNPAVGGVGKGQVVRELDALGGIMGKIADLSGIQYRILNESKGYAVQSTRVQVDKDLYAENAKKIIAERKSLVHIEARVSGVKLLESGGFQLLGNNEEAYFCKKLVVTTGTFLNGKLHSGEQVTAGGRVDCLPSVGINDLFSSIKTHPKRFKTGTPARLKRSTLNFDACEEQPSDERALNFHFAHYQKQRHAKQISCYLTRTNPEMMEIIRENKERSPMYNGQITGIGPRYCPSIEDKAFRYPDRNEHHIFLEPEGLNSESVYPNGLSTSLPHDVQRDFYNKISGLESSEILVYGYAVEYDVVDTAHLDRTLQYKEIPGLYFAGQVNGTSGYEEAAGQGLMAGINAALSFLGRNPLILDRENSYIGVMIDDLVHSTRDEPYRLFTARSENRLFLREDNSALRMKPYREQLALNEEIDCYLRLFEEQFQLLSELVETYRYKDEESFSKEYGQYEHSQRMDEVLKRAHILPDLFLEKELVRLGVEFLPEVVRCVAISKKYAGYINRASNEFLKTTKMDRRSLDWKKLLDCTNISFECKQRISKHKPETFLQLQKIEGIRPATLVFVASSFLA